jgi:hypothetical protein
MLLKHLRISITNNTKALASTTNRLFLITFYPSHSDLAVSKEPSFCQGFFTCLHVLHPALDLFDQFRVLLGLSLAVVFAMAFKDPIT